MEMTHSGKAVKDVDEFACVEIIDRTLAINLERVCA